MDSLRNPFLSLDVFDLISPTLLVYLLLFLAPYLWPVHTSEGVLCELASQSDLSTLDTSQWNNHEFYVSTIFFFILPHGMVNLFLESNET